MSSLSLSCGMRQRQSVRLYLGQRQVLTQKQKLSQRQEQLQECNDRFGEFLGFVSLIWGHQMQPSALCERCGISLSITEIVLGFKSDVNDFTTQCPKCKQRFEPTNLVDQRSGEEHGFWCANQTLERLPGKEVLEVEDFKEQHPEVFFSALFHFGSLLNAFKRKGIEYRREQFDWSSKAKFCLGQIPDTDLSDLFGVSRYEVSQMRKKLNIPRYSGKGSIIPANRHLSFST